MKIPVPLTISILACMTSVLASPLPQEADVSTTGIETQEIPTEASSDPDIALEQLNLLLEAATNATNEIVESGELQKRGTCTLANLSIRREWGTLSSKERTDYTSAVLCLQKKTAKTPSILAPGAKTRYDDFVATHINQTLTIHYTGTFLAWHRYYTWQYEQALKNECGYKGTQPYWDWAKTAVTGVEKSPIWDGSATSMSGNGAKIDGQGDIILTNNDLPPIVLPSGSGGGCVTSGPFKSMSVNLGPVSLPLPGGATEANPNGPFAYNPRCLKRDLTSAINTKYANAPRIVDLILNKKTIDDFQMTMQGIPGSGDIGVHGGGHFTMGGDPGRDLFVSPGDPVFYLHHGMIDRTWWMWQMLDPYTRQFTQDGAIDGTNTFLNSPPSPDTTLDTVIDFGFAATPPRPMRDLLSTISGPFCYIYA